MRYSQVPAGLRGLGMTFMVTGPPAIGFMALAVFNCNQQSLLDRPHIRETMELLIASSFTGLAISVGMFTAVVVALVGVVLTAMKILVSSVWTNWLLRKPIKIHEN